MDTTGNVRVEEVLVATPSWWGHGQARAPASTTSAVPEAYDLEDIVRAPATALFVAARRRESHRRSLTLPRPRADRRAGVDRRRGGRRGAGGGSGRRGPCAAGHRAGPRRRVLAVELTSRPAGGRQPPLPAHGFRRARRPTSTGFPSRAGGLFVAIVGRIAGGPPSPKCEHRPDG